MSTRKPAKAESVMARLIGWQLGELYRRADERDGRSPDDGAEMYWLGCLAGMRMSLLELCIAERRLVKERETESAKREIRRFGQNIRRGEPFVR